MSERRRERYSSTYNFAEERPSIVESVDTRQPRSIP